MIEIDLYSQLENDFFDQTEKAVKEARGLLEYVEDAVAIPRELIGRTYTPSRNVLSRDV